MSYLVARLTGAQVFDHGLASTTMLYGLTRRDWEPELLDAFGIAAEELPEIAEAGACTGGLTAEGAALTGLTEGLPVAVGTRDDFSTPLGAGLAAPGRAVCVLGTAEVVGALDPHNPGLMRAAWLRPIVMPAAASTSRTRAGSRAARWPGCARCSASPPSTAWPPRPDRVRPA